MGHPIDPEFELDFITASYMLCGQDYTTARESAKAELREYAECEAREATCDTSLTQK